MYVKARRWAGELHDNSLQPLYQWFTATLSTVYGRFNTPHTICNLYVRIEFDHSPDIGAAIAVVVDNPFSSERSSWRDRGQQYDKMWEEEKNRYVVTKLCRAWLRRTIRFVAMQYMHHKDAACRSCGILSRSKPLPPSTLKKTRIDGFFFHGVHVTKGPSYGIYISCIALALVSSHSRSKLSPAVQKRERGWRQWKADCS